MSHAAEPLRDEGTRTQVLISGAVAGLISRFVIAPLDVIKIRLQLQSFPLSDPLSIPRNHRGPVYKGTYTTLRTIIAHEGVTGLWKGNIPAEALYLTYGSASFLSYRSATQVLSALPPEYQLPGSAVSFIAGAVAGTAATTVTYPLDLLRTRFAAQGTEKVYTGVVASVRDITKHEGFPGLFRGLSAGIGQIVPYMGVFFALYEGLKPAMMDVQLPLESMGSGEALAGVISGVLSKTMVFPLDTVRKRLQVQGPTRSKYVHGNIPECKGVLATVGTIFRHEGVRGLYRGLPVSLIKAAPASAITMWAYEMTMGLLRSIGVGD